MVECGENVQHVGRFVEEFQWITVYNVKQNAISNRGNERCKQIDDSKYCTKMMFFVEASACFHRLEHTEKDDLQTEWRILGAYLVKQSLSYF